MRSAIFIEFFKKNYKWEQKPYQPVEKSSETAHFPLAKDFHLCIWHSAFSIRHKKWESKCIIIIIEYEEKESKILYFHFYFFKRNEAWKQPIYYNILWNWMRGKFFHRVTIMLPLNISKKIALFIHWEKIVIYFSLSLYVSLRSLNVIKHELAKWLYSIGNGNIDNDGLLSFYLINACCYFRSSMKIELVVAASGLECVYECGAGQFSNNKKINVEYTLDWTLKKSYW